MSTMNETVIPYPCHPDNKPHTARRPVGAVLHHMAGYLPGTDSMFRNPATGYATNIGIGSLDGANYVIHEYVPEGEVAWGNGNDHLNRAAISIEHENNRAAGPASKPTHETHELSARYLAAAAVRHDWRIDGRVQLVLRDFPGHDYYEEDVPGFGVEFNVTGHRTVALKPCPNDLDMVWIVNRANDILSGSGQETSTTKGLDMPRLIRNYDTSIGFLAPDGTLEPLGDMGEVNALLMTGLVGDNWVQMTDGTVWNALTARTARIRAVEAADIDEDAVAAKLAPLVVSPILAALAASGVAITPEQFEAIAEGAIRRVFADAGASA